MRYSKQIKKSFLGLVNHFPDFPGFACVSPPADIEMDVSLAGSMGAE